MRKQLLLALSSAVLLILIAPRWSLGFLAPVAILPLLLAAAAQPDWRKRLALGLIAGIPYWFFVCLWIEHVLHVHGGLDAWLAWFSFLLFCFLKSLHMALFAILAGLFRPAKWWWWAPLMAALWTGIERTHGTFGFAWLTLGNAAVDFGWLLGIPTVTGVYGLSFLFALSAAAAAQTILTRRKTPLLWLAAFAALPIVFSPGAVSAPTHTALVVQPMMPQASEWTREMLEQRLAGLARLSNRESDLLIWPEMPGPVYFDADPGFHELAVSLAQSRHRYFLFGTVTHSKDNSPYNSAIMLDPAGAEVGRYHKNNLVPFGEFVPAAFAWVNRITQEAGDFKPGTERTATTPASSSVTSRCSRNSSGSLRAMAPPTSSTFRTTATLAKARHANNTCLWCGCAQSKAAAGFCVSPTAESRPSSGRMGALPRPCPSTNTQPAPFPSESRTTSHSMRSMATGSHGRVSQLPC
jgi:apolipoprotein N-acyltransferase